MKYTCLVALYFMVFINPINAQQKFNNYADYCAAIVKNSRPSILARLQGITREEVMLPIKSMTDPVSIKFVKELVDFLYSDLKPKTLAEYERDLYGLCVNGKIFSQ